MLRIALPNKGTLSEDAVTLVREAGYGCRRYDRELVVWDSAHDVEFVFLRPRDIPIYVSNEILHLGLTGRDLVQDSGAPVEELLPLAFGRSTFRYAVPQASDLVPSRFGGLRVATSYSRIVENDLRRLGVEASVVKLDGAVEISVQLGVADVIADVVESGRTLREAGLKTVGEPVMRSEAILIARHAACLARDDVSMFVDRLRGIVTAREYAVVEYDCPQQALAAACEVTPGIEAPTIAPLAEDGWVAVKAMCKRREVNAIMDRLADLGARGIMVSHIQTCRI